MIPRGLFSMAGGVAERQQMATTLAMLSRASLVILERHYSGDADLARFRRQQRAFRRWMLRRAGWRARMSTQVARHQSKRRATR